VANKESKALREAAITYAMMLGVTVERNQDPVRHQPWTGWYACDKDSPQAFWSTGATHAQAFRAYLRKRNMRLVRDKAGDYTITEAPWLTSLKSRSSASPTRC